MRKIQIDTTPEYTESIGVAVKCPPANSLDFILPSCLTAKMKWHRILV